MSRTSNRIINGKRSTLFLGSSNMLYTILKTRTIVEYRCVVLFREAFLSYFDKYLFQTFRFIVEPRVYFNSVVLIHHFVFLIKISIVPKNISLTPYFFKNTFSKFG